MGIFEPLVRELASKFGLGAKAGSLVGELLRFITNQPRGVAGFIDECKSAGFGNLVASWLGRGDAHRLWPDRRWRNPAGKRAQDFAASWEFSSSLVTSALTVAIPKVIGLLTPGSSIPTGVPPAVSAFLGGGVARLPSAPPVTEKATGGMGKWLIPALIVLGLLGLGWYLLTGRPTDKVATTPPWSPPRRRNPKSRSTMTTAWLTSLAW